MEEKAITVINNIEIVTVDRDDEIFVPIKPICEAIGISSHAQREKLLNDDFFSSTGSIIESVGADGKSREMFALPLRYVYGWLDTINPGKVAPEAREAVSRYRRECYEVLYNHFTASMAHTIETNKAEIEILSQINETLTAEKEAKARRKSLEQKLQKLRSERLNPQPRLF